MFIFNEEKIKEVIKPLVTSSYRQEHNDKELTEKLRKNTLDVFSAMFESAIRDLTMEEWIIREKQRQIQKTLQNKIGKAHQDILGTIGDLRVLKKGLDLESQDLKFIAEIKNKHNTTKGNHLVKIYDDLLKELNKKDDPSYTAYYVEMSLS